MSSNSGKIGCGTIVLVVIVLAWLSSEMESCRESINPKPVVSSTLPKKQLPTSSPSPILIEPNLDEIRERELASQKINNDILLGFRLGMSPAQYKSRVQSLIRSGTLDNWSETTYCARLFTTEEIATDRSGSYLIQNAYDVELKWDPMFIENKLVKWEFPVWDNIRQNPDEMKNIKKYLDELYGASVKSGGIYYWIQGNREIRIMLRNVENPPYGSEVTPVIEFRDNSVQ